MLRYSEHAAQRARERGINIRSVVKTIERLEIPIEREVAVIVEHYRWPVPFLSGEGDCIVAIVDASAPKRPRLITVFPSLYKTVLNKFNFVVEA